MNRRKFLEMLGVGVASAVVVAATGKAVVAEDKPIAYYTGSTELNPPRLTCFLHPRKEDRVESCYGCLNSWSVVRGFPRKHKI